MRTLVAATLCAACAACAACATEPPTHAVVSLPAETQEGENEPAIAESRTVPLRFETRRLGAPAADAARWSGRTIDLDVKDADVQEVFRLLADVGHINIVVPGEVSGRITLRLKQVPWDQALDVILRARGLGVERDGNVYLVVRP